MIHHKNKIFFEAEINKYLTTLNFYLSTDITDNHMESYLSYGKANFFKIFLLLLQKISSNVSKLRVPLQLSQSLSLS